MAVEYAPRPLPAAGNVLICESYPTRENKAEIIRVQGLFKIIIHPRRQAAFARADHSIGRHGDNGDTITL